MVCKTQMTTRKYRMAPPSTRTGRIEIYFGTDAGTISLNRFWREISALCIVLVFLPNLEFLSGPLPGELLNCHLVYLAPNLPLHLGDLFFRINSLGFSVVQYKSAAKQMGIFEGLDAVLCISWRLKLRKGKSSSILFLSVK